MEPEMVEMAAEEAAPESAAPVWTVETGPADSPDSADSAEEEEEERWSSFAVVISSSSLTRKGLKRVGEEWNKSVGRVEE